MAAAPLWHGLRRFWRDESGSAILEAMMFIPLLAAAWVGVFVFWDGFSSKAALQRATHAAADMLAREMVPVDTTTLAGLDAGMELVVPGRFNVTSRFTAFRRTGPNDADVAVVWSHSPGALLPAMTDAQLQSRAATLPALTVGSHALIVDTTMNYAAPMNIPLVTYTVPSSFSDWVVLRPYYVAKLCQAGVPC